MKKGMWLGTSSLMAWTLLLPTAGAAPTVAGSETVVDNGDPSNRYDIVFVGDGYTEEELALFRQHVATSIQRLRSKAPYSRYWSTINVHRVDVVSKESGFTDKIKGIRRDTAFGVAIGERVPLGFITGDQNAINRVVARNVPDADAIVCLINKGHSGVSTGKICFAGTKGSRMADTVVHELGHTIGRLADEYVEHGELKVPPGLVNLAEGLARPILGLFGWDFSNVTSNSRRSRIPWKHWIESSTPLPTPEGYGKVGLYRGAFYFSDRFYRPEQDCIMRGGSRHCVRCREVLSLTLARKVVPYRWTARETAQGVVLGAEPLVGRVDLRARWYVDGREVAVGTATHLVRASALPGGTRRVRVELQDATPWVRLDGKRELIDSHDWYVRKSGDSLGVTSQKTNQHRPLLSFLGGLQLRGDWSRGSRTALLGATDPVIEVATRKPAQVTKPRSTVREPRRTVRKPRRTVRKPRRTVRKPRRTARSRRRATRRSRRRR